MTGNTSHNESEYHLMVIPAVMTGNKTIIVRDGARFKNKLMGIMVYF
jgi:hypothetical protein